MSRDRRRRTGFDPRRRLVYDTAMAISTIPEVLDDLRRGKMIILVDDPGRENEGDLAMLAEHVTAADINFMARHGRGLICMPVDGALCEQLELGPLAQKNTSKMGTGFTV